MTDAIEHPPTRFDRLRCWLYWRLPKMSFRVGSRYWFPFLATAGKVENYQAYGAAVGRR